MKSSRIVLGCTQVNCLMRENTYNKESMMLGIRRSLRGEAAAMLMRLGETTSIDTLLCTFHSTFGNTETAESILEKCHACKQEPEESVVAYTSRIKEFCSQAVEHGAVIRAQQALLSTVFMKVCIVKVVVERHTCLRDQPFFFRFILYSFGNFSGPINARFINHYQCMVFITLCKVHIH